MNDVIGAERYLFEMFVEAGKVSCLNANGKTVKPLSQYGDVEKKIVNMLQCGLSSVKDVADLRGVLGERTYSKFTLREATDTTPESLLLEIGKLPGIYSNSTRFGG